jgi:hypothetical protein
VVDVPRRFMSFLLAALIARTVPCLSVCAAAYHPARRRLHRLAVHVQELAHYDE